jgi:hypothetical protein
MAASKKRGRGQDRRGRSKTERFVMLQHWLLNSEAWGSLKPSERALFVELKRRHNGSNNGQIGLSCREAAKFCKINADTASKGLRRLTELGFTKVRKVGAFSVKCRHSTEYELTDEDCDGRPATKDFMSWRPKN